MSRKTENTVVTYANDVTVARGHNLKVTVQHTEEKDFFITFMKADTEPEKHGATCHALKGKVRVTNIRISEDGLFALFNAFAALQKKLNKENK